MGSCVSCNLALTPNPYFALSKSGNDYQINLIPLPLTTLLRASIQADLAAGTTVVIDRYYYSGCVYSAAKLNPKLDLVWARHPEVGLPRPDICVFLDISAEDAAKRGGYGEEKYEQQEMQVQVRRLFNELMASKDGEDFVKIDAGRPLEEVKVAVSEAVRRAMEEVDGEERPLRFVEAW